MKIYTKTGDKGETSLFGGRRVSKDELRIEAYGTVDELNSAIGIARSFVQDSVHGRNYENKRIDGFLGKVQDQLFVLGADLATPEDVRSTAIKKISVEDYTSLEKSIDEVDAQLPQLKSFVLPGGSKTASFLHHARTICRRAERHVVSLRRRGESSEETVIYLNRLSDFLFVLARYVNEVSGIEEILWNPRGEQDHSV